MAGSVDASRRDNAVPVGAVSPARGQEFLRPLLECWSGAQRNSLSSGRLTAMPATTARDFWSRRDLLHDGQASPVWSSIYCTIRDRRRSRSSSSTTGRSRTPSASSGRTTPSPSPQLPLNGKTMSEESLDAHQEVTKLKHNSPRRFMTTCLMEPQNVPIRYSSTVLIDLSSTKKRYIENITFQTRLLPRRFSEGVITPVARTYTTTIEIPCLHSVINTIKMDSLHQQMLQHQVEV